MSFVGKAFSALVVIGGLAGPGSAKTPFTDASVPDHSADAGRGEIVFHAAGCGTCHGVDGAETLLAGGRKFENRLGTVFAPNITPHPGAGIGDWTKSQFLNALLLGRAPDGSAYIGAFFPHPAYARMTPGDALDLHAFLMTLEQSDAPSKPHEINLLSRKALLVQNRARPPLTGTGDAQMQRGEYLVEALGHCGECHTPRKRFAPDPARAFTGWLGFFGDYAPDISAARLASVDPADFIHGVMVEGRKLNGRPIATRAMRRIAASTANLSVEDRAAIFAYLSGRPVDLSTLDLPSEPVATASTAPAPAASVAAAPRPMGVIAQKVAAVCEAREPALASAGTVTGGVSLEIETAADRILDRHCRSCHGPGGRNEAVFPMLDIVSLGSDPRSVVAGDLNGSPLYASISSGRMPIGPKMDGSEIATLEAWITALASAPEPSAPVAEATAPVNMPRHFNLAFEDLALAAVSDLESVSELDHQFIRYLSFATAPLPQVSCDDPADLRDPVRFLHAGLNKFINSVSRASTLAPVTPVAGTEGALVRIDIRDYGWTLDDWAALTTRVHTPGAVEAGFDAAAWADLAPRYPSALDPNSESLLRVLAQTTGAMVPVMDADWFTRFGSEAPYYDMLLRLPPNIQTLEARMGIDVNDRIRNLDMIRAGFRNSGVSDHNRMLERFDLGRGGYYWKSYDFAGDEGRQVLLNHPDGPEEAMPLASGAEPFEHDGGEMIFSLANGMQGYYLSTADGARLSVGPTSIVSFRNRPIGRGIEIVNARSCFDCHADGIIRKSDEVRAAIMASNAYSRDAREALMAIYPEQPVIDAAYAGDRETFLAALSELDAVATTGTGGTTSLPAPKSAGAGEIVTYLADLQFAPMGLADVARSYFLSEEEFLERIPMMGDAALMQIANGWVRRFDSGLKVARSELNEVWGAMLPRLTDLRPLGDTSQPVYASAGGYSAMAAEAYDSAASNAGGYDGPDGSAPAFEPIARMDQPLTLALQVPQAKVKVNDILEFTVSANRRCELQIHYVEETKTVEVLPQEVLGPEFLEPGEIRRIPWAGSGLRLRFDTPGQGETMVAFCREGGLGDKRLTAADAIDFANTRFQPLSRGLIVERSNQVASDLGSSAVNAVTFDVRP